MRKQPCLAYCSRSAGNRSTSSLAFLLFIRHPERARHREPAVRDEVLQLSEAELPGVKGCASRPWTPRTTVSSWRPRRLPRRW
ncbi:hypothetical protein OG985_04420 [Streptomyces sp. NBC_00289]|uniref:hypothetical protein n=1 Tax=Streptomyces sp. NBC_00289 TaxID=2975703 RepID=UPI003250A75A